MNKENILWNVLNVFMEYRVKMFPTDCFDLLHQCGYTVITYQKLKQKNEELYQMCQDYSDESFRDGKNMVIAYNDEKPALRIRFSLAHELGHHVLGHLNESRENEMEANYFASCLLAPRMAIHYCHCLNALDVARLFQLSDEASRIAYEDYQIWYHQLKAHNLKMTRLDKAFYDHFYDETQERFICNVKTCDFCGRPVYNSVVSHCQSCEVPDFDLPIPSAPLYDIRQDDDYPIFQRMEYKWLYGDC